MAKRIDWEAIHLAFTQRNPKPTETDLAAEFGATRECISRKCTKQGWNALRTVFQERVRDRRMEKDVENFADVGAEFDKQMFTFAQWLAAEAYNERKVNLGKIFEVAKSIEIAQRVGKAALGDKPPEQDVRINKLEDILGEYQQAVGGGAVPDRDGAEQPVHPSKTDTKTS